MEIPDMNWRKSSYSGNGGSSCIEVASDGAVMVRDTKDSSGPVLRLSPAAWRRFADQVKRSLTPGADDEGPRRSHPDRAGAFAYWQLVHRRRYGRPGRVTARCMVGLEHVCDRSHGRGSAPGGGPVTWAAEAVIRQHLVA
jgi:hypothetical protein